MITVEDLIGRLQKYCDNNPGAGKQEVFLQYDGDVAFPFGEGSTHDVMGSTAALEKFLVLVPDFNGGKKLVL